jgi:hypothetical protein
MLHTPVVCSGAGVRPSLRFLPGLLLLLAVPAPSYGESVAVLRPNGGEKVYSSDAYTVEWSAAGAGDVASFDLEFSADGGATFSGIPGCSGLPATARACLWTAPGPTTAGLVRITASTTAGATFTDTSNARFSVLAGTGSVTVTAPGTNATWAIGTTQTVKWKHTLGARAQVAVDLSRDGGSTWTTLADRVTSGSSAGSLAWPIAGPASDRSRIRVRHLNTPARDESIDVVIADPFLRIDDPPLDANWGIGTQQRVTWTTNLGSDDRVDIKLSADGGRTFPVTLASKITASARAATITVPDMPTAQGILLVEFAAAALSSISSRILTVAPPFVTVVRPNAPGDVWSTDVSRTVAWSDNLGALERVRLDLSLDGGTSYPVVLAAATPADGSLAIKVSSSWMTESARVRVTWLDTPALADSSDSSFVIRAAVSNARPVAKAGPDLDVAAGSVIRMSGAASADPDGNTLTYTWTMTSRPLGSSAELQGARTMTPSFVADLEGIYKIRLVVDDGVLKSGADTLIVTAASGNTAPIADAGPDQLVASGATVTLDGTASLDAEGAVLGYAWSFAARPDGSTTTIANSTTSAPSFLPDVRGRYIVQLVVTDGATTSAADAVEVTVNTPPASNAGSDRTVPIGTNVELTGAGSTDPDGQRLSYFWTFVSRPSGSDASLSDLTSVTPSFTVDRAGDYVLALSVSDPLESGVPDAVTVSTHNSPPAAHAGPDQSAVVGSVVTLDGTGSTDVDGDALRFTWSLTRPPASVAVLSDTSAARPTFTLDRPGTYVASLVADDGTLQSAPDTVIVTTLNSAPVAAAGADLTAAVGGTVRLDGTGSTDVDGDLLTYEWSLLTVPEGSAAELTSPGPTPEFVADRSGTYVAQLIVRDGTSASTPDSVTVTTTNTVPIARAGADQTVSVGTSVVVDGGSSSDADGDVLEFAWSIAIKPEGSAAVIAVPDASTVGFMADAPGTYVLQLIVSDGRSASDPDTVVIATANSAPVAGAGEDRLVSTLSTVGLDGSGSRDADGDVLSYRWSLLTRPEGSAAVLADPTARETTFVADLDGTYVAQLVVHDGTTDSAADTVSIVAAAANRPPIASAGTPITVEVGTSGHLDGSGSSDPDGDALAFEWTVLSRPAGSVALPGDDTSATPTFVPDQAGEYLLRLVVSDGRESASSTVSLTGILPEPPPATLAASPTWLAFSVVSGAAAPPSQHVTITVSGGEPAAWVASFAAPWLIVGPGAGAGSDDVSIGIDPSGLAPGLYKDTVRFEAPGLDGSPIAVAVTLAVDPAFSEPVTADPGVFLVRAGEKIQPAIDAAAPGSTILLEPGTYVQNLVLPAKENPDGKYITITTASVLLPEGRVAPALKASLAVIRSPSTAPAVRTNARASHYRLVGLAFDANSGGETEIIRLGDATTQITLAQVPHHFELDRLIVTGGASGQKRGVLINASDVLLQNSDISNIWMSGQDSQAVAGWNTPGRITIRNNRLEAASENIMFGGADPAIRDLVPADILIEDNFSTKNLAWRGDSTKEVKNAFELKAARRVTIRRNIFERVWKDGQDATAIVLKTSNSGGACTACITEDILFEDNIVRSAGAGIAISGWNLVHPSGYTRGITIRNNLFYDISTSYGGNGRLLTFGNNPSDVVVDRNTAILDGTSVVYMYEGVKLADGVKVPGGPIRGFRYTNNLSEHRSYGIMTPAGSSARSCETWLPGAVISHNVLAGAVTTKYYPPDNYFPAVADWLSQFTDPASHDWRLMPGSPFGTAGSDGGSLGVDHARLPSP